jgi:hypothetical protein
MLSGIKKGIHLELRSVKYVAYIGKMIKSDIILVGKPERKFHFEDTGLGEMMTLKWILKELGVWTGLRWLSVGSMPGCCE